MSMCGPELPCARCQDLYEADPRYVRNPDPLKYGSDMFVIAHDVDHRKRLIKGMTLASLPARDRLPVPYTSKRDVRRRRRAKQRRRS